MPDNVKQHVVPRFYIALFHADGDARVFVRVRGPGDIALKSPSGQGYEEDAFTIMNGEVRDLSCDETNKSVEDCCAPRLAALSATLPPSDDQWRAILLLTANLLCRSRWMRDNYAWQNERVQRRLPGIIDVLANAPPLPGSLRGMGFSPEELKELPGVLERASHVTYPLVAYGALLGVAEDLKQGKGCDLLIAPSGSRFISSDDPAIILENGKAAIMKITEGFLTRDEVEIYLPLMPTIACLWSSRCSGSTRLVSSEQVSAYNKLIWDNCYERAFASRAEDLEAL